MFSKNNVVTHDDPGVLRWLKPLPCDLQLVWSFYYLEKPDIQEATTRGQSAQHPTLPLLGGCQPYT